MTPESIIEEIRARLQLSRGTPTLLLAVVESDAILLDAEHLLLDILRTTPLEITDLGISQSSSGPAHWAELTRERSGMAFSLAFIPSTPLSVSAFARILNAERELLRQLAGPLLLFVSRDSERALRRHAPDFFTWVAHGYQLPEPHELHSIASKVGVSTGGVTPALPSEEPIRFLHISDIHLRLQRTKRYDQDRVLDGLIAFLQGDRAEFPLDLLFVTGDLAQSGKAEEYVLVSELLQKLMEVTKVPAGRVFAVPGNHDVDREVGRWLLRTLGKEEEAISFFEEPGSRKFHEQKLAAYRESMGALLGAGRPHGMAVGAAAVEMVDIKGSRLAIASFNSAWFAQGDDDLGKLWLGEPNVERALDRIADGEATFALALMHHPFEYLHEIERDVVERWFERGFDLVLRGHLHANKTRSIASQRGGFVEVAGPAAYQGSQWPNGCFLGEIRAAARKIRLRPFMYSTGPDPWVLDTRVFPDAEKDGYCHEFAVPEKKRLPSGVARPLRAAAEASVKKASSAAQREIAGRLESIGSVLPGTVLPGQASSTVRTLADSPELWADVFGKGSSGLALAQAVTEEARKNEWHDKRISYADSDAFERALMLAGRIFLKVTSTLGVRGTLLESTANLGLASALGALVDTVVVAEPMVSGRFRPDIVIGRGATEKVDVVEVKQIAPRRTLKRITLDGLQQLDTYIAALPARHAALILLGGLSRDESEPRLERSKTPAGNDVILMSL